LGTDRSRFRKHIKPSLGAKEPQEIAPLDVDRIRLRVGKNRSAQTVKHVLVLLKRLANFGVNKRLCSPLGFKVEMPTVDNITTEYLSPDELTRLLKAINESEDLEAAHMMLIALYTGMRRSELFRLKWSDVDFQRGFIHIRNPKGKKSQDIPLNPSARAVLEAHPKNGADYIFTTRDGKRFTDIRHRVNPIKIAAGLPKEFRPLHGLRHAYASMLASSGKVDMYVLQKLLTHKSPLMTQRYAHLQDEALRRASALVGEIISGAMDKAVEK
jgi:integrase